MFQASDIVLLPFPYTDLSAAKRRPVLVLRSPDARGDFLAVQITSHLDNAVKNVPISQADLALGKLPLPLLKSKIASVRRWDVGTDLYESVRA